MSNYNYYGQAEQDKFVCNVLQNHQNGVFVEIGSQSPTDINNTYILENKLGWTGLMLEIDKTRWEAEYCKHRPKSKHIFGNALQHNYQELFKREKLPSVIDYLQLDIDPGVNTYTCLSLLDEQVMNDYTFRVITFEHDYYANKCEAREKSRNILNRRGYYLVFGDICNRHPEAVYEDWYVHPDFVDMNYIKHLQQVNELNYESSNLTGRAIDWYNIVYPDFVQT